MASGPLAVRWDAWTLADVQAGAVSTVRATLENTGTVAWRHGIFLSYHWLDDRGNPIVWDGERTPIPVVAPGERASVEAAVRAPIPPGRYGFALDLVAENRAWFEELGSPSTGAEVDVGPRVGDHRAELPDWVKPAPDWAERVAAAHEEGYGVAAGAIDWDGGLARRRPAELAPYAPGSGRMPGFTHPLVCPSVMAGVELERLPDVAGLPAVAAPLQEPWLYDGRIVLRARSRAARRSG
jgi:hypothetical protein